MNTSNNRMLAICLLLGSFGWGDAQIHFDDFFMEKTMRLDYIHAGDARNEYFFAEEVIEEPHWAGNKTHLLEEKGRGNHLLKVKDKATDRIIYSRGFNSLFNEWQTTPEAQTTSKAMPEGVTFPYPKHDVIIELYTRRNDTGMMMPKFTYEIDADHYAIRKSKPDLPTTDILYTGDPNRRVDIVLIPEGFTESEKEAFLKACHTFADDILSYAPYDSLRHKFNIRAVWAASEESGVSIPGENLWRNTALRAHYYTFGIERYQMLEDYQRLLDIAANVPYDVIYVLTNSAKYGGGGIYNFYGISAANISGASTRKTYSHEFGHLFAGLADEYVGGTNMSDLYFPNVEPWEPNITTLTNLEQKKWHTLLPAPPVLTEVGNEAETWNPQNPDSPDYDPQHPWETGIYEGGGYVKNGVYRPWPNCMMNWFHRIDVYCPVCSEAICETIAEYTE